KSLRRFDIVSITIDDRELIRVPMEDRSFVVPFLSRRHLAAAIETQRLEQDGCQVGATAKHVVVQKNLAGDAAPTPSLCCPKAQQSNNISRVGMKGLPVCRLINARVGIFDAVAKILHVTQDVTLTILRHWPAEVAADAEKSSRGFLDRIAFHRNAADDRE